MNHRRRTLQIALAVAAVLALFAGQTQAADTAATQPKIQFTAPSHDFGKAGPNMELKHSFSFKNTGKALLVIEDVKAG